MNARLVTAVSCVSGGAFAEGAARTSRESRHRHKALPPMIAPLPRRQPARSDASPRSLIQPSPTPFGARGRSPGRSCPDPCPASTQRTRLGCSTKGLRGIQQPGAPAIRSPRGIGGQGPAIGSPRLSMTRLRHEH